MINNYLQLCFLKFNSNWKNFMFIFIQVIQWLNNESADHAGSYIEFFVGLHKRDHLQQNEYCPGGSYQKKKKKKKEMKWLVKEWYMHSNDNFGLLSINKGCLWRLIID